METAYNRRQFQYSYTLLQIACFLAFYHLKFKYGNNLQLQVVSVISSSIAKRMFQDVFQLIIQILKVFVSYIVNACFNSNKETDYNCTQFPQSFPPYENAYFLVFFHLKIKYGISQLLQAVSVVVSFIAERMFFCVTALKN